MNETKFYKLLKKAKDDDASLIIVINQIMPLINRYSLNVNEKIDDDLRSILVEYAIKIIKDKDFANKLMKK